MSEITDLRNDPTVSFWGMMDAGTFCGDTIKDKYEGLYIKLVEMSHVLIRKGGSEGSLTLTTGRKISLILSGNGPWETEKGKFDLGRLNDRWQHYLDDDNRIEIGSDKGKAVLLIVNGEV